MKPASLFIQIFIMIIFVRSICAADAGNIRSQAEAGVANAQVQLGNAYAQGIDGAPPDNKMAVYWWKMSAAQGQSVAQYNLGEFYCKGMGVKQNYKKALKWFIESAKQKDRDAENSVGLMYENGFGVRQDAQKAAQWYRRAAEHGNPTGQSNLGVLYFNGTGVAADPVEGYAWFYVASLSGEEKFLYNREFGSGKLTARQLALGQQKGRQYIQTYSDVIRKGPIRVSHILIVPTANTDEALADARTRAVRLRTQAVNGASTFSELAQASSDCPSKANGGDLGLIFRGTTLPAFETAAFALEPGDISGVVQTRQGFHIITRTE